MNKIYYFFSCYNNYDILINEQTDFIRKYREKIIILDDQSSELEAEKGRKFCENLDVVFVINKYKGLQMGIKYLLGEVVSNSAWLICLQPDTFIQTETSLFRY